ncbi:flagellin [Haloterrigena sp. SYSU A558-1]|uniref:Flagellin n=1 Tax=Haloterrigena gelatinilytica TaxID=2741724 RepID=A0A8J8GHG3_9EURY|nr:flagellin [Haloterrigena gelatinilytica]NUB89721.1 flagellin [Haloterrigena gelatinilytica]NUC74448.1 flagellin [Haloterrigena gelatinilytica]
MGFSTSGAAAILFVGALVAVGIAYPVIQTAHEDRRAAIDDRDDRSLDLRNTDLELEETTYNDSSDNLTVNATNVGSTTLSVSETDLLIDGEYEPNGEWLEVRVDGTTGRELWQPGETLSIVVSTADRPDRVKLVTEHGVAATTTEV